MIKRLEKTEHWYKKKIKAAMRGVYRFQLYPLTGARVCGRGLQVLLHSHTHMFGRIGALLSIDQCTDKNIFSVDPYFKAATLCLLDY